MFKAMLAGSLPEDLKDFSVLRFPVLASPKLDGVRATVQDGRLLSRNLKPIPNRYLQGKFGRPEFNGLDGELICGMPTAEDVFRVTTSAVMGEDGEPDVNYFVFDQYGSEGFEVRLKRAEATIKGHSNAVLVPHQAASTTEALLEIEKTFLNTGFEGLMLRAVTGRYKEGRSTLNEGLLLKLKRFQDGEAVIIGFDELKRNDNEKTLVSNGKAKRSHHKGGLVAMGTLGALLVRDLETGIEFKIGTGLDDAERKKIWNNRPTYLERIVKYKHFPKGIKTKPRFPSYQGLRDPRDM